ncbi:deazaflavin-dependent nitroreductase [Streptomyces zagrosensis]|uniref:Deazaflavin-dependent oxidoreductase (Nitroreductase family) n=1 Tax=Streptomyces zagrosensis TaxID=1042984 RepID=A0A7W9QAE6_9ACTN|nr:deazaflavin-dependent nitroreductase [Streptomyces zagrosensis]MBB5935392.1 deazaflavin-dependent oxidoreductase (nitroreductase family) [Streptomyces zagrosensis]
MAHYIKPGRFEARVIGGTIAWLARRGISLMGSAELSVRGRTTGEWRSLPVNPLPLDGGHYLVSARGTTQWVRNMRAAGGGQLRKGRRIQVFRAIELPEGTEKNRVIRAYLKRWAFEVGKFFNGVTGTSSDAEVTAVAVRHPVFTINYEDDDPCAPHTTWQTPAAVSGPGASASGPGQTGASEQSTAGTSLNSGLKPAGTTHAD